MGDSAHEAADASIEAFRREVAATYREAERSAEKALSAYLERFERRDAEWRERVGRGEATEAEWKSWRRGAMLTGKRYRAVLDQMSQGYTHANQIAMDTLSGRLPGVYAENYNYGTYQVETGAGVDTAFALQDASTVGRLLTDHDSYLPKPTVKAAKDAAWNRRLLANHITQGVLLGEPIPKIAKRVRKVTGSNAATATRTARTAVTAAENVGRVDSYRRAQSLGIELEQEWMATLDVRTRSSHRQLDGQRVKVGGKFGNGCRYPGDPEAAYAETCNCRCTLVAAVEGVDYSDGKRWSCLPKGMTYEEWKAGKPAVNGAKPANRTIADFMDMPGTARKLDAAGVSKSEARRLLTRQLREYGIPSGSFRKMGAGDQQKALDAALAKVRRIAGKPNMSARVYSRLDSGQRNAVKEILKGSNKLARNVYLKYEGSLSLLDGNWAKTANYSPTLGGVRLNLAKTFAKDGLRPPGTTWFHEFGHMIDGLNSDISETYDGGIFAKTIRKEVNDYIDTRNKEMREGFKAAVSRKDLDWLQDKGYLEGWRANFLREHPERVDLALSTLRHSKKDAYRSVADEISGMTHAQKADLSDLFGGATLNKCNDGWGHSRDYWKPKGAGDDYVLSRLSKEGFAEFFSAYTANPESLAVLRKYLPESSKIFDEILKKGL